ncbi:septation protein IspZ [Psittacicella gerlachiana]|nr:septation protein IspZ [Psittacicella gerlachiana]
MSPREVAAEYSAIALTIALIVEIIIKNFCIKKLSKFAWFMYFIILCFTIPSIIFNDIKYIQLKFYLFKVIFIITIIILMHKFNINLMQKTFSWLIKGVSEQGWKVINYIFVVYLVISVLGALYCQFVISQEAWVLFKGVILPVIGVIATLIMIGYGYYDRLQNKKQDK